jgi:hypothetical protein
MPRFFDFRQSRQRESERRPGLAKPGFALKFASFAQFLCLSVCVPAVRVFPAASGLIPQGSV